MSCEIETKTLREYILNNNFEKVLEMIPDKYKEMFTKDYTVYVNKRNNNNEIVLKINELNDKDRMRKILPFEVYDALFT